MRVGSRPTVLRPGHHIEYRSSIDECPHMTRIVSAFVDHQVDGVVRRAVAVVPELDRVPGGVERHAGHGEHGLGATDLEMPALDGRWHASADALLSDHGPHASIAESGVEAVHLELGLSE